MTSQAPDPESTESTVEAAVELLQGFELTEYEARCMVALVRLGSGTAKDVSRISTVPQARVYDCMETLRGRGLASVQHSSPRQFRARSPTALVETLRLDYERRSDRLADLFTRLRTDGTAGEDGDVWVIEGRDAVTDRLVTLVESATQSVRLAIASEDLLSERLLETLSAAAGRDVDLTVASPGEAIRTRVRAALPAASVVETWTWWRDYPVDNGALTAVALVDDAGVLACADDPGAAGRAHRAVWTDGAATPLVRLLSPLLEAAIDPAAAESA